MDGVGPRLALELSSPDAGWDHRYLAYFVCFNAGRYFEAHEVLEDLWLMVRRGPDGLFYQGLIQLAGALVHLQKGRREPARRLLLRARFHLEPYGPRHWGLELGPVLRSIDTLTRELKPSLTNQPPRGGAPRVRPDARLGRRPAVPTEPLPPDRIAARKPNPGTPR